MNRARGGRTRTGLPGEVGSTSDGGRLHSLQRLVSALSRALTVDDVGVEVVSTVLAELHADAAMICLYDGDTTFRIAQQVGYLPETVQRWSTFSADAPLPAADAIRTRRMVALETVAERDLRYPDLRGAPVSHESTVVLPMIVDDRPLGILSFGFTRPRRFPSADRDFLTVVTEQCAQAIHRAQLYEQQRVAADRQAFLARASRRLAGSLAADEVAAELAGLVVPGIADAAVVRIAGEGGLRVAGIAHRTADGRRMLEQLLSHPSYAANPRVEIVADAQVPLLQSNLGPEDWERVAVDEGERRLLEQLDVRGTAVVPLQARGRTVGTVTLAVTGERDGLGEGDVPFLTDLATYAALAIDNAQLFDGHRRISETLQLALLPAELPAVPGLDIGARYLAAGSGSEVGGDFYDVFRADADRWIVVLGDVRGRGPEAAATTGLVRHTVRAVGFGQTGPAEIQRHVNRALLDWHEARATGPEPRFCAVNVIVVEPSSGRLTVCCAGNPLPVIARPDGTVSTVGWPGTVAGVVEDPELVEADAVLAPGDTLFTFTDGISERRHSGVFFDEVLDGVVSTMRGAPAQQAAARLETAARQFGDETLADDIAVVAVRWTGESAQPPSRQSTVARL